MGLNWQTVLAGLCVALGVTATTPGMAQSSDTALGSTDILLPGDINPVTDLWAVKSIDVIDMMELVSRDWLAETGSSPADLPDYWLTDYRRMRGCPAHEAIQQERDSFTIEDFLDAAAADLEAALAEPPVTRFRYRTRVFIGDYNRDLQGFPFLGVQGLASYIYSENARDPNSRFPVFADIRHRYVHNGRRGVKRCYLSNQRIIGLAMPDAFPWPPVLEVADRDLARIASRARTDVSFEANVTGELSEPAAPRGSQRGALPADIVFDVVGTQRLTRPDGRASTRQRLLIRPVALYVWLPVGDAVATVRNQRGVLELFRLNNAGELVAVYGAAEPDSADGDTPFDDIYASDF